MLPTPPFNRRSRRLLGLIAVAVVVGSAACALVAHGRSPAFAGTGSAPIAVPASVPSDGMVAADESGAGPGGTAPQPVVHPQEPAVTVPILAYHYVRLVPSRSDALGITLSVTPTLFAEQMALLRADGAHPVTLARVLHAMESHTPLPAHPVVLTFDDGYADFATTVEPILAHNGFVGTDYVVSAYLTRPGFMTAAQVLQMDRDGMVIGSHTVDHVNLASLPSTIAAAEINGGKAGLERLLGHPVLDFAYPYGAFTTATESLAKAAGIRDAVTTVSGSTQSLDQRFAMRRWHMGGVAQNLDFFASVVGLPTPSAPQVAAAYVAAVALVGIQPPQAPPDPAPTTMPTPSPSRRPR